MIARLDHMTVIQPSCDGCITFTERILARNTIGESEEIVPALDLFSISQKTYALLFKNRYAVL